MNQANNGMKILKKSLLKVVANLDKMEQNEQPTTVKITNKKASKKVSRGKRVECPRCQKKARLGATYTTNPNGGPLEYTYQTYLHRHNGKTSRCDWQVKRVDLKTGQELPVTHMPHGMIKMAAPEVEKEIQAPVVELTSSTTYRHIMTANGKTWEFDVTETMENGQRVVRSTLLKQEVPLS